MFWKWNNFEKEVRNRNQITGFQQNYYALKPSKVINQFYKLSRQEFEKEEVEMILKRGKFYGTK